MSIDISFTKYKEYNSNDSDFTKPRGNMFTYATRGALSNGTIFDYNFGGIDTTTYPISGIVLNPGGGVAPSQGIFIKPNTHQVMYISSITIWYNLTGPGLFGEYFKETGHSTPPTDFSWLEIVHSGFTFCRRYAIYGIAMTAEEPAVQLDNAFGTAQLFFGQKLPLACPGRFDGDDGDSFGFKSRYGTTMYLGANVANNKLTHLHFTFTGWTVDKVLIDGSYKEIIPLY